MVIRPKPRRGTERTRSLVKVGGAAVAAPPTSVGHEVPSSFTGNRNIGGVKMFYFIPVVVVFAADAADAVKRVTL